MAWSRGPGAARARVGGAAERDRDRGRDGGGGVRRGSRLARDGGGLPGHPRAHRARCARLHRLRRARQPERRIQHADGPPRDSLPFGTATGKANFTVNPVTAVTVPAGPLLLQTVRSHDQFNTTMYGLDDRYRGVHGGRRVVFVARQGPGRARTRRRRPGGPGLRVVRRRGPGARVPDRRVPDAARLRRGVLPGDESRAGTAGLHGRDLEHADLQVRDHPPGPSHRSLRSKSSSRTDRGYPSPPSTRAPLVSRRVGRRAGGPARRAWWPGS